MNKINIIIDGVQYDSVRTRTIINKCKNCDLKKLCNGLESSIGGLSDICINIIGSHRHFKKSTKRFKK